jgi:hypothetical protein
MSLDLTRANLVRTRTLAPGQRLPLVIEPATDNVNLAEWASANHEFLDTSLSEHGGILFRGFDLATAVDFENVARSIYSSLYADYGDLPRTSAGGAIYESTPYPPDKVILFHNESSHLSSWPMKISFFCLQPAREGGTTPIVDCRAMCEQMDPKTRETFAQKGLLYVRNFVRGLDVNWQEFFQTDDRTEVERRCSGDGMSVEWTAGDGLRVMQRTEAVRVHPRTGAHVFFSQVELHHPSFLEPEERQAMLSVFGENGLPRNVLYGDGSPIPDAVMHEVGDLYDRLAVDFVWLKGDMVMLDNMLTAHSRSTFVGPRKIVVAMGEMIEAASA